MSELILHVQHRQSLVQILRSDTPCLRAHDHHRSKALPRQKISPHARQSHRDRNHPGKSRPHLLEHFFLWVQRLQNHQRVRLALQRKFSRQSAISVLAPSNVFKQSFRPHRIVNQLSKRSRRKQLRKRRLVRQILRENQHIPFGIEHREHMIAKSVLDNGYSRRHFRCVRPVVVQHLRLHRRQERLRELRKVAVRSLQRAAPKNKIGNQRQHHQKQREHARVPKREPYPHRVKHGFSCLARYPWPAHAALPPRGSPLRLRPPRQKNTPRPVACAAAASLHGCQFFAARGSRTPRSDSKTDRSSRPTRARQFPPGPPRVPRCAPEIPAAHIPWWSVESSAPRAIPTALPCPAPGPPPQSAPDAIPRNAAAAPATALAVREIRTAWSGSRPRRDPAR